MISTLAMGWLDGDIGGVFFVSFALLGSYCVRHWENINFERPGGLDVGQLSQ